MTGEQKQEVKRTARKLYRDARISLETAVWAMKNAGYTEKETAKIYGITGAGTAPDINAIGRRKNHDNR